MNRSVLGVTRSRAERAGELETRVALSDPTDTTFDPFLMFGHHGPQTFPPGNKGMPFGDHPHRGFETVTFVLEGAVVHNDSSGHHRTVGKGGVQWMTAGAGVVHSELVTPEFLRDGGLLEVIQLWINLPARLKMAPAAYTGIQAEAIPVLALSDASTLHLVSGEYGDKTGPIASLTGVFMSWIALAAGDRVLLPAPAGRTILLYVVRGNVSADGQKAADGDLFHFADKGEVVELAADTDAVLVFAHGDPIGEPVVARGPFVMNSEDEIDQAFQDYHAGKFRAAPAATEISAAP